MSKNKKDKDKAQEVPIDFTVETKNLNYTITLRDLDIASLQRELETKNQHILNLETELANVKHACVLSFKSEKELQVYKTKYESLEQEVARLTEELQKQQIKFEQEKARMEEEHLTEVNRLKTINEGYHQKIEMVNQLIMDKELLTKHIEDLNKEKTEMQAQNDEKMRQKEVKNQIKFTNLKKKMMDNINQTQAKVTELNIQYMDVSTKLTLLQNHQLLIQLEYQSQQIDELTTKKDSLEKKVFELSKDIEIHKEVELSLAEKNKKLRIENASLKSKTENTTTGKNLHSGNNITSESLADESDKNNLSQSQSESKVNANIMALEKKISMLEKRLAQKNKEYNRLKDNSEYIELRLRNYEKKYAGIFNFFEESLRLFCEDEEIKNNNEIYVNIESLQNGDFTVFSKEEKYSILVILMKYLLPLVNSNEMNLGKSSMSNINLKFHYNNSVNRYINEKEMKKIMSGGKSNLRISSVMSNSENRKSQSSVSHTIGNLPAIQPWKI
jgi:hypothetical protein